MDSYVRTVQYSTVQYSTAVRERYRRWPRGRVVRAPAIIPDAAIVSLPRGLASAGQRPERQREPERRHLVDVKTIHRGARDYREARGTRDQSGRRREHSACVNGLHQARAQDGRAPLPARAPQAWGPRTYPSAAHSQTIEPSPRKVASKPAVQMQFEMLVLL